MHDQRASKRFKCESPVTIENCKTGKNYEGILYNYSREGMYLELDHSFRPGSEIRISIEKENGFSSPKCSLAKVIWCDEIPGPVVLYNYGIGVLNDPSVKLLNFVERFQVIDGGANKNHS